MEVCDFLDLIQPALQKMIRSEVKKALEENKTHDLSNAIDFIETLKIKDCIGKDIAFKLSGYQEHILEAIIYHDDDVLIKKYDRQVGMTWLLLAYALWKMMNNKTKIIYLVPRAFCISGIKRNLEYLIRQIPGLAWNHTADTITIFRAKGASTIHFLTNYRNDGNLFAPDLLIIDEWQLHDIDFYALRPIFEVAQTIGVCSEPYDDIFLKLWENALKGLNKFYVVG